MRVLVTAVKNSPSKRASRLRRACSQAWWSGRVACDGDMRCRLAPRPLRYSPFSDINAASVAGGKTAVGAAAGGARDSQGAGSFGQRQAYQRMLDCNAISTTLMKT